MIVADEVTGEKKSESCFLELKLQEDRVVGFSGLGYGIGKYPNMQGFCGRSLTCKLSSVTPFETELGSFKDDREFFEEFNFTQKGELGEGRITLRGKKKTTHDGSPVSMTERVTLKLADNQVVYRYKKKIAGLVTIVNATSICDDLVRTSGN